MTDERTLLLIIAAAVVLFVTGRIPVALVALGVTAALFFTGLVNLEQAFAGFGDPVIIFIAGLFVVAVGLETTGITAWVGQWLAGVVKGSRLRLSVFTVLIVALLSPLISTSGAVAAFVPVVTLLALKLGDAPSKYLIPLAFASGAGSKLALTGTPKNVLISDASMDAGYGGFGFFEFAWVGIPLLLGTIAIVALFGRRLLPERTPANLPADFGRHAETLVQAYGIGAGARRMLVGADSPLIGQSRETVVARSSEAVDVVTVAEGRTGEPLRRGAISAGDIVVVRGDEAATDAFAAARGLSPLDAEGRVADALFNKNSGLAEVVVPPRSPLVGVTMSPGMVPESGDLVVLAIHRTARRSAPRSMARWCSPSPR